MAESCRSEDFLSKGVSILLIWWVPILGMGAIAILGASPGVLTVTWTAALLFMGAACLRNAWRCGRLHCYITGPFYLLLALATVLHGSGAVALGSGGWYLLYTILIAGTLVLSFVPEWIWGRYVKE